MHVIRHHHKRVDLGFGRKQSINHQPSHVFLSKPSDASPCEILEPFPRTKDSPGAEMLPGENPLARHSAEQRPRNENRISRRIAMRQTPPVNPHSITECKLNPKTLQDGGRKSARSVSSATSP